MSMLFSPEPKKDMFEPQNVPPGKSFSSRTKLKIEAEGELPRGAGRGPADQQPFSA